MRQEVKALWHLHTSIGVRWTLLGGFCQTLIMPYIWWGCRRGTTPREVRLNRGQKLQSRARHYEMAQIQYLSWKAADEIIFMYCTATIIHPQFSFLIPHTILNPQFQFSSSILNFNFQFSIPILKFNSQFSILSPLFLISHFSLIIPHIVLNSQFIKYTIHYQVLDL